MMTIMQCIRSTSRAFGVPVADIRFGGRAFEHSHPRQAAMLLARWEGYGFARIGRKLGNRDHSTVVHGCQAAERRIDADEEYGDRLQAAWIGLEARTG